MKTKCERCERQYEYNRSNGHRKHICNSCNVTLFRKRRKEKCVEYKGGKCELCGYNKCIASLQFHHKDPSKKDFGLSQNGMPRSWDKCKNELDKCVLVCANCHFELHYTEK